MKTKKIFNCIAVIMIIIIIKINSNNDNNEQWHLLIFTNN